MPKLSAFLHRDRQRRHGHGGVMLDMEVDHLLHVHPVDMVGAEHRDQFGLGVIEQVEILKDRVGGAVVPGLAQPHLGRHRGDEVVGQQPAELPAVLEMLDQRL